MTSLLIAAFAGFEPEFVDLSYRAKAGMKSSYSVVIKGEQSGEKIVAEGGMQQEVIKLGKEGFTLRTTSTGTLVRIGSEEIRDDRKTVLSVSYGLRGNVLVVDSQDQVGTFALARATRFIAPEGKVMVGSEWTFQYPESKLFSIATIKASVRGVEVVKGRKQVTISYDFSEKSVDHPMVATGIWLIDASNGVTISTHSTIQNWMDGGTKPGTYVLALQ